MDSSNMREHNHVGVLLTAAIACAGGAAWAHHSTITYDTTRQVQFAGTVTGWTVANPHAYLIIVERSVQGPESLHRCESFSVAALQRLGVDAHSFATGDSVVVTASPSRVDPTQCLLESVQHVGGQTISFLPAHSPPAATLNSSIYGMWERAGRTGPPASSEAPGDKFKFRPTLSAALDHETPLGRQADMKYQALHDDPAYHCSPVGPLRVWHEPDTAFAIRREGDHILLDFEFMDAKRIVHLQPHAPVTVPASELGYSAGHFEGDVLVIETTHFLPGVIAQYALDGEGRLHGLLHSDQYSVIERIRFDKDTAQLEVQFSQSDPKFYTVPLVGETLHFSTSPRKEFAPYRCELSAPPTGTLR
jgi:hypothetical protein